MSAAADAPLIFQQTTLDNGLTIVGEYNPRAQSFAAGYMVSTGARDETAEVAGVSHFLEHMMFKGSERRNAADINREFDELGANYNAFTSEEMTVYYGAVLPEKRERLLDLLSDMMRPALRESDFELEKNVILEEIAMYQDRPTMRVFEEGNRRFYNGHPLGNSVLGSDASVGALSREQMLEYFNARYAPNNMTLTVTGNYDWQHLVEQIRRASEAWRPAETERHHPELEPKRGLESLRDSKLKRAHIALYAPGVSIQDPRRYAAAVLATCLGDSSGSRFYWALVDNGLADSASLYHDASDHAGTFVGYLSTAPELSAKVMEVVEGIFAALLQGGVSEAEWRGAQRKLATGLTLRGETPFGRLISLGSSYQYLQRYQSVQDVVNAIMATTPEDAHKLIAEGRFEQRFALLLSPEGEA